VEPALPQERRHAIADEVLNGKLRFHAFGLRAREADQPLRQRCDGLLLD
jgi:hypothetical protein